MRERNKTDKLVACRSFGDGKFLCSFFSCLVRSFILLLPPPYSLVPRPRRLAGLILRIINTCGLRLSVFLFICEGYL
jgi:hypothetical protein